MRLQKLHNTESAVAPDQPSKKRKASTDDAEEGQDGQDTVRKRAKPANGLPEGFFDAGTQDDVSPAHPVEMQIPSRPATPSKPVEVVPVARKLEPTVDEDEWASFQADIATAEAEVQIANDAVISAPAMSAADIAKKSAEEQYTYRKEKQEAEIEGDKEDAARKMEEELDEMESLEARVKKLREKREGLRRKESVAVPNAVQPVPAPNTTVLEDDDEDEEEDDEWDGFRMR